MGIHRTGPCLASQGVKVDFEIGIPEVAPPGMLLERSADMKQHFETGTLEVAPPNPCVTGSDFEPVGLVFVHWDQMRWQL